MQSLAALSRPSQPPPWPVVEAARRAAEVEDAPCSVARVPERREVLRAGTLVAVTESDDLVTRCQAGDREAFRALFRNHRNDVARLVHRMLGPSSDLEDVVQEVFLQVYRSIRDFRGNSRFTTWLYRVTVNVVLMHRRASRSRPVFEELPSLRTPSDPRPLPDEQVARRARVEAFKRLLDRLSDKKRTVFVLHELEGIAPSEIARIVGAPVLTVRTRLFYARRELAQMLEDEPTLAPLLADFTGQAAERELASVSKGTL